MNLRCYTFGNMYMSSIQQGIQAAHAIGEMFVKYNPLQVKTLSTNTEDTRYSGCVNILYDWATHHKTMICLNAGNNNSLCSLLQLMQRADNPYAWAVFYESQEAMQGMLTNIAIILPESVYSVTTDELDIAEQTNMWSSAVDKLIGFDKDLIRMKSKYRMVR